MAKYRQVHTSFWHDGFVLDLTPEEKYFYVYLMTNSKTSQCGIYELPFRIIETDTGYNRDTVEKLIERFTEYGKILYSHKTKEIMILNWMKYNFINSKNTISCINKELHGVKNTRFLDKLLAICNEFKYPLDDIFKGLIRGLDTPCRDLGEEEEREEEREEEKEEEVEEEREEDRIVPPPTPFNKIKELFNENCKSLPKVRDITKKRKPHITARWKQFKYDLEVFIEAFKKIEASDFCKGQNNRGWKCTFDWLIQNDTNMIKVLEGKYDNVVSIYKPPDNPKNKKNKFNVGADRIGNQYTNDELEKMLRVKK